jgi:hypothetical protein
MVNQLTDFSTNADKRLEIRRLIFSQMWDDAEVQKLVNKHGNTSASLLEEAMSSSKDELIKLDQLIGLRMKTLMQL